MNFLELKGNDHLEKFAKAMAWLRAHPGSKLVIPPGVYEVIENRARAVFSDMLSGKYGGNPPRFSLHEGFVFLRAGGDTPHCRRCYIASRRFF